MCLALLTFSCMFFVCCLSSEPSGVVSNPWKIDVRRKSAIWLILVQGLFWMAGILKFCKCKQLIGWRRIIFALFSIKIQCLYLSILHFQSVTDQYANVNVLFYYRKGFSTVIWNEMLVILKIQGFMRSQEGCMNDILSKVKQKPFIKCHY